MRNAMIIDDRDNVIVAIEEIKKGSDVTYFLKDQTPKSLKALEDITIYHKIAAKNIKAGEPIIKYGEHIGIAAKDIKQGEHVHVHNVESRRENLDE